MVGDTKCGHSRGRFGILAAIALTAPWVAGCAGEWPAFGDRAPTAAGTPVVPPLAPAPAPEFRSGDTFVFRFATGLEQRETVVSARGRTVDWSLPSGARWTTETSTMFDTSGWSGTAQYGAGRQNFGGPTADLFPLRVGNVMRYAAAGASTATPDGWQHAWTCSVASQERVAVAAGAFDTFKVVCYRAEQIRAYYYAPDVGMYVLRRTTGRRAGVKELVSYARAGS